MTWPNFEPHEFATPGTLANRLYNADCYLSHIDSEVYELLTALLGEDGCSRYTADYYDCSIEIYGVGDVVLTAEQQQKLWDAGFAQAWTHVGEESRQDGEMHFARPRVEVEGG